VQGGFGACFWYPSTNFIEFWRYRGKILIGARKLSRYTGFLLREDARVPVQEPLQSCLECWSKSKNCDEQLTHFVRVSGCTYLIIS